MERIPDRVAVATVSQPMDATLLQLKLGSFGIESELDGDFTVAANPLLSNAIGGIRVVVSTPDAERATRILAEHFQAQAEADAAVARICPKCGGKNGNPVRRPLLLGFLAVLTLGVFCLVYPWPRYRCPDCNHKWR